MAGKTIDEVTPDVSIGGYEKIPVSDAGTAKSVTTEKLKDYVISAIASLTGALTVTILNDSVYIKQNGEFKPLQLTTLCDSIYDYMFNKTAVTTFNTNDLIAVENSGSTKTTTLGALCDYIEETISPSFDIHTMDEGQALGDDDEIAIAQQNGGWEVVKKAISNIASYVIGKISSVSASISAIGSDDYVLILTGSPLTLKRVKRSDAGIGSGDVNGPSTTTENNVPQWDATTKTLKNGKEVSSSVTSSSTDSQIPTASAVYSAIVTGTSGAVIAPSNNYDGYVPQWNGSDTKTLKNGLSVQTSVRESSSASDSAIPTEKAVRSAISSFGNVNGPSSSINEDFARFDGTTGKLLKGGISISTSISHQQGSVSDSKIPTEKAVRQLVVDARGHGISFARAQGLGNYSNWASVPTTGYFDNDLAVISISNRYYLCVFINNKWWKISNTDGGLDSTI